MKTLKTFAIMAAMLLCCVISNAQTLVDGIYYNLYYHEWEGSVTATATVTNDGNMDGNYYSGNVVIPETVIWEGVTYTVNGIDYGAFSNCYDLQSVSIPNSIRSIGSETFSNSSSLKEVSLPNQLETIGERAFSGCYSLITTIPTSVTFIGSSAFTGGIITLSASDPSWLTIDENSYPFGYPGMGITIVVPDNVYNAYITSENWAKYRSNIYAASENIRYEYTDDNGVTWSYRYVLATNSLSITNATGYTTSLVFPATLPYGDGCLQVSGVEFGIYDNNIITSVDLSATSIKRVGMYGGAHVGADNTPFIHFSWCQSLKSVALPSTVEEIGYGTFGNCPNLETINWSNLTSLKFIGHDVFVSDWDNLNSSIINIDLSATKVESIESGAFRALKALQEVKLPVSVTSIGNNAFDNNYNLRTINLSNVKTIGANAFNGTSIASADLSSVTSVGSGAFQMMTNTQPLFTINNATPATIALDAFPSGSVFVVPNSAVNTYRNANVWSNYASNIVASNLVTQNVALTAASNRSDLEVQIGVDNLASVVNLTISGSINSYDFMVMRNKMPLLRHLDLGEAHIVGNNYCHYENYCTHDNELPSYGLYGCKLLSLVLPGSIDRIAYQALSGHRLLTEIDIPESVSGIGSSAFDGCSQLTNIKIPSAVKTLESSAFYGCHSLRSVEIPKGIERIEWGCFSSCSSLTSLLLPPSVTYIGGDAFISCSQLTEVHLPSSLRSVGDHAFNGCNNLKDVYVYVVEPISIGQNTFTRKNADMASSENNFISTLHAPKSSFWDYYYDTQWSQFLSFAEFEGTYDNFYLEGDKTLDNETGSLEGEEGKAPDAELGNNSGIIVGGDVNQELGDVDVEHDGENGGSIIVGGEGGVTFENLTFHINVQGGRWYFFCFPFDVKREDIKCENGADWVFRYYDGEERASNGKGGWKNVTSDDKGNFLKAATGYIFQCSKDDVLTLTAKNGRIQKEKKYNELKEHVTENMQDASWNFVGNPYLSYYEISQEDYSAPITVWDGNKYIAIRPGDENYTLAPFEAFFVQKPSGTNSVNYNPDNQKTYNQTKNNGNGNGNKARMAELAGSERLLVNITLSDGKETDRTRVVFNERAAMDYELECDASKFITEGVPQLYTLSTGNVEYAINERPMAQGCVNLGFSVPVYGKYTIEGLRMDVNMLLMDNLTGEVHDLSKGAYEFTTESGIFNNRFTLVAKGNATGINETENGKRKTENGEDADNTPLYNIKGQQVKTMEQGEIYIKNNVKVTKN